jgi:hypothetical protein
MTFTGYNCCFGVINGIYTAGPKEMIRFLKTACRVSTSLGGGERNSYIFSLHTNTAAVQHGDEIIKYLTENNFGTVIRMHVIKNEKWHKGQELQLYLWTPNWNAVHAFEAKAAPNTTKPAGQVEIRPVAAGRLDPAPIPEAIPPAAAQPAGQYRLYVPPAPFNYEDPLTTAAKAVRGSIEKGKKKLAIPDGPKAAPKRQAIRKKKATKIFMDPAEEPLNDNLGPINAGLGAF